PSSCSPVVSGPSPHFRFPFQASGFRFQLLPLRPISAFGFQISGFRPPISAFSLSAFPLPDFRLQTLAFRLSSFFPFLLSTFCFLIFPSVFSPEQLETTIRRLDERCRVVEF